MLLNGNANNNVGENIKSLKNEKGEIQKKENT